MTSFSVVVRRPLLNYKSSTATVEGQDDGILQSPKLTQLAPMPTGVASLACKL